MSNALDTLASSVDAWLLRLDADCDVTDEGFWTFRYGSTIVMLSMFEHEDHPYLRLGAVLVFGAQPSVDVLLRLLRLNTEVIFGAFQLFDDGTIAFTHTLPGNGLTYETFSAALEYVASVGDDHDEELQALAGGKRGEDLLEIAPVRG